MESPIVQTESQNNINGTTESATVSSVVKFESFLTDHGSGFAHRMTPLFEAFPIKDTYGKPQVVSRLPIDFQQATQRTVQNIKDILHDLSAQGLNVTKFRIGKTFVNRRRDRFQVYQNFDPMYPDTWDYDINVFSECKEQYQGLIIVGCVTRDVVPPLQPVVTQEEYTTALEQQLILHFKYNENDQRLQTECSGLDRKSDRELYGGVLYIAVQYDTS